MSSKIIVVSTRPPKEPLSGGMAPAVKRACEEFDEVVWYAVGNSEALKQTFETASTSAAAITGESVKEYEVARMAVKEMMVDSSTWDSHYNKVSNSVLWPLAHDRFDLTRTIDLLDVAGAHRLNELMAEKIAHDLKQENDSTTPIWIHDYHHFAMPAFLRKAGVQNPIVFFNHIPLPDPDLISSRLDVETHGFFRNVIKGLSACDAVNFQTSETASRFMKYMGVKDPNRLGAYKSADLTVNGRNLRIGHYPISIDTEDVVRKSQGELRTASGRDTAESMIAPYIFLNFERCDYSKGIEPRLLAFEKLLKDHPELSGKVQIVIGAEPTRNDIQEYIDYKKKVHEISDRINSNPSYFCEDKPPVILLYKTIAHDDLCKLMRSDKLGQRKIGTVTPYRDGMNLVAKEFAASQDPKNAGPLILSSGAGAAAELTMGGRGALVYDPDARDLAANGVDWINPSSPDEGITSIYRAMLEAINMPQEWVNDRCVRMQNHLETNDIKLWSHKHKILLSGLASGTLYGPRLISSSPSPALPAVA